MKKTRLLLLCLTLALALALTVVMASCDSDDKPDKGTETTTAATTDPATEAPSETEPETETQPAESETVDGDESQGDETESETTPDFSGDGYVVINNVEDLMAFNKAVNEDWKEYDDVTVVFTADIDMEGYKWVPLDGTYFYYITFDGQGHTIKNMTIDYNLDRATAEPNVGAGFIGTMPAGTDVTFKNITFEDAYVTARERHVGCLVGRSTGGNCYFEDVTVKNFTVDGWTDYNNTSADTDGWPIAFRVAGVLGATWGGDQMFTNVTVDGMKISGFHNLAGLLGYAATANISEYSFENCTVKNAEMYFSYCLADVYTPDMPRKFVSVFFNGPNWVDNIDACVENGNTYSDISYYDVANDNTEYTPDEFRSWTLEEQQAAAAG